MRIYPFAFALVLAMLTAGTADARGGARFAGAHPISAKLGGGYCYIESPHVHAYVPDHTPLYAQVGDHYVFTGDPTPFGYEGEKHPYYGHHPVVDVNGQPVYCYLDGPHSHAMAPGNDGWKIKKGVAFYVGPFAPVYAQQKPQRVKAVNAEYRPYVAQRPRVDFDPPEGYTGEVYVTPPSVEINAPSPGTIVVGAPQPQVVVTQPAPPRVVVAPQPQVIVNAPQPPHIVVGAPQPRVVVAPPTPSVYVAPPPRVVVGGPRVVVGAPAPHVVVGAPAPRVYVGAPAPHVYVGAPAPHVVVGAPAPGVVVVGGKKGHHDNGKHKGWYK